MTTAIEKHMADIDEAAKQRQVDAGLHYHELVRASANGDDIDAASCAQILADAGKSVEDLASDAQLMAQRCEWRAMIDSAATVSVDMERAEAELNSLLAERDEMVRAINERIAKAEIARAAAVDCQGQVA